MNIYWKTLSCLILLICGSAQTLLADTIHLNATEQSRYRQLTEELRCVVCQNQDLAESNTPLAAELRHQIAEQVHQQKSDNTIKAYLSARYGEFILFKPSFSPKNYVLWLAPFILLFGALWLLFKHIIHRKKTNHQTPLSTQEAADLERLLKP